MRKPQSLFDHLQAAVPAFRTAPDQLSMLVREGRVVAASGPSLSFEYVYTLQLVALDFSGHPDAIMVPLLAWLRVHQPELADNPELRAKSLRFEAQYLSRLAVDLSIEIDLTERVVVARRPAGAQPDPLTTFERWEVTHAAEPARIGVAPIAEHWQVWDQHAGELLAEWQIDPERV
jgi:hypothetical protein